MRKVGVVVARACNSCRSRPLAVFQAANVLMEDRVYETRLVSEGGGARSRPPPDSRWRATPCSLEIYDTLLVAARIGTEPAPAALVAFAREAAATSRGSAPCARGLHILAQAGLLSQRRATTHWRHARELQARFPDIRIEADRLFVNDGPIWTSAGMDGDRHDAGPRRGRSRAPTSPAHHRAPDDPRPPAAGSGSASLRAPGVRTADRSDP